MTAEKNPKFVPKIAEKVSDAKIDHGWNELKDQKVKTDLKNKIAEQSKGQTPLTTKATLPPDVAQKLTLHGSPSPAASQSPLGGGKGVAENSHRLRPSPVNLRPLVEKVYACKTYSDLTGRQCVACRWSEESRKTYP